MVSRSFGVKDTILGRKPDFENGELSLDLDMVKTFFQWLVFVNDGDSVNLVELMQAEDSVFQNFCDEAGAFGGNSCGLKHNLVDLLLFARFDLSAFNKE